MEEQLPGLWPAPWAPVRWTRVGGVPVRYVVGGAGPVLVLLHGLGGSLEDWAELFPRLTATHRVYALDLIGFGLSGKPDVAYSVPGLARFVRHALDTLGETNPVTLVGSSLGGAVAQSLAVQAPARTRALVLISSAGFGRGVSAVLRAMSVPGVGERLTADDPKYREQKARGGVGSLFADPSFITDARRKLAERLAQQPDGSRAFLRVLRSLGSVLGQKGGWRHDLAHRLRPLRLPMLIVWGDRDRILPARHLRHARRLHPQARTHLFLHTGHQAQTERAEELAAMMLEFLGEVEG